MRGWLLAIAAVAALFANAAQREALPQSAELRRELGRYGMTCGQCSRTMAGRDVTVRWGFHYKKITKTFLWIFEYDDNVVGYTPDQAANAAPDDLMRVPVFAHTPEWAFEWEKYDDMLVRENKTGLLNHVVPAMSQAAGRCELKVAENRNLNTDTFRNGWGRKGGTYKVRWLHCDLKDMAYFYNFRAWDSIVSDGNFKKKDAK